MFANLHHKSNGSPIENEVMFFATKKRFYFMDKLDENTGEGNTNNFKLFMWLCDATVLSSDELIRNQLFEPLPLL